MLLLVIGNQVRQKHSQNTRITLFMFFQLFRVKVTGQFVLKLVAYVQPMISLLDLISCSDRNSSASWIDP